MDSNQSMDKYFSDDEQNYDQINNESDDDEYEIDAETRRIIFEHQMHNLEKEKTINTPEKKNKKVLKQNKKQTMTLKEFNNKVEQDMIARKPKKFMSKRVGDKKTQLGIQSGPCIKRSFNPRNQPFNFVKSNDIKIEILNLDDFPSL
jgi:hypothetical protein